MVAKPGLIHARVNGDDDLVRKVSELAEHGGHTWPRIGGQTADGQLHRASLGRSETRAQAPGAPQNGHREPQISSRRTLHCCATLRRRVPKAPKVACPDTFPFSIVLRAALRHRLGLLQSCAVSAPLTGDARSKPAPVDTTSQMSRNGAVCPPLDAPPPSARCGGEQIRRLAVSHNLAESPSC